MKIAKGSILLCLFTGLPREDYNIISSVAGSGFALSLVIQTLVPPLDEVVALLRDDAHISEKDSSRAYLEREVNQEKRGFVSDIAREIVEQIVANIYKLVVRQVSGML
jgi:hypothetical protein